MVTSKTTLVFAAAALLSLILSTAEAQRPMPGPGTGPMPNGRTVPSQPRTRPDSSPFRTKTISGELVEVKPDQNSISVKVKDGKVVDFVLDPKTKLKADKKTELADKKNIELADFQAGQTVEITVNTDNSKVEEVKLKRDKKS
jgi:hypothetical protein